MKGKKPHQAAAREAMEEAGLIGNIGKLPIGSFTYPKRLKNGASLKCELIIFAMKVEQELKRWPEANERSRRWFSLTEAIDVVGDPGLRELLRDFGLQKGS